jgi:TPR repeat protein
MKYSQPTPLLIAMFLAFAPIAHAENTTTVAMATSATASTEAAPVVVSDATATLIPLHMSAQALKGSASKKGTPKAEAAQSGNTDTLDVTVLDQRIATLAEKAQHYPPQYADKRERRSAEVEIKDLVQTFDPYAVTPSASAEILLRAVKVNQMARNMDVGTESALKAGVYMRRLIALQPANPEANYWYGIMLSEGGGVKEGIPYLNKAAKNGFKAAYLSLAHAYLMLTKKTEAVSALESYRVAVPEQQAQTETLLEAVRSGSKTGIW